MVISVVIAAAGYHVSYLPISELHFRKNLDYSTLDWSLETGVARVRERVEAGCLLSQLLQRECVKKGREGRSLLEFLSLSSFCWACPRSGGSLPTAPSTVNGDKRGCLYCSAREE